MPIIFETDPHEEDTKIKRFYFNLKKINEDKERRDRLIFTVAVIALLLFYTLVYSSPPAFPVGKVVTVEKGTTLSEIIEQFEDQNVVRSGFWLKGIISIAGVDKNVFSGDYFFPKRRSVLGVARMITTGDFGLTPVSITIPEGYTVMQISNIFADRFATFSGADFVKKAADKEGYLFPDTYYFLPNVEAEEVIKTLEATFFAKLIGLEDGIEKFGKPLGDVVKMASIIELEARTTETRRIIAGILWKRIKIGMPLQVDASFNYVNGKNTFQLSLDDLKIDSPYNTYKYKGLTITPISNPGIDSLYAASNPIVSDYLYFLSDMSGIMHYSRTFDEHKRKKQLYLK